MNLEDLGMDETVDDARAHVAVIRSSAFEADTLYRIVDLEAGVVCYHVSEKDSLACLPLSDTALDPSSLSETESDDVEL